MEPGSSLPRSQVLPNCRYPVPDQSSPHHPSRHVRSGPLSPQHGASSGCGWGDGLQLSRIAANILNKRPRTNDKGWSSSLGLCMGQTTSRNADKGFYFLLEKCRDVTPYSCCKNQRFRGTYRLHHQGDKNRRAKNFSSS
jgi:hypothetical protein